jgi:N-acetylglutamate synthase-like GNAT family acetyltransferase
MSMPSKKINISNTDIDINARLTEDQIKGCYDIAEQIAVVSRFYKEPLIGPEKTKKLYRKWIDNSLNKSFGEILISKSYDIVTGIHVIKTNHEENAGLCSLIGVNNNYKGLGIGNNLWKQAFIYWNQHKDIKICKVPFSINNCDSFNFHLKMGFNKIEEIKYVYHYRKNKNLNDSI